MANIEATKRVELSEDDVHVIIDALRIADKAYRDQQNTRYYESSHFGDLASMLQDVTELTYREVGF